MMLSAGIGNACPSVEISTLVWSLCRYFSFVTFISHICTWRHCAVV